MNVNELVNEIEVSVNREVAADLKKAMNDLGTKLTEKINAIKGEISVNDTTGIEKYVRDLKIEEFKKRGQQAIDVLKNKIKMFEGDTTVKPETKVETEEHKVETTQEHKETVEPKTEVSQEHKEPVEAKVETSEQPKVEVSNTTQAKPKLDTSKLFGIA